jgi:hypothetical protein
MQFVGVRKSQEEGRRESVGDGFGVLGRVSTSVTAVKKAC